MSFRRSTTCRLHNHYSSSPTSQNHCRIKPLFCAAVSKTNLVPSVTCQNKKKKWTVMDQRERETYGLGHTLVFHDQIMHVIFDVIMEIDGTIRHYFELWVGHTQKQKKIYGSCVLGPDSRLPRDEGRLQCILKSQRIREMQYWVKGTMMDPHGPSCPCMEYLKVFFLSFFPWTTSSTRTCSS